MTARELMLLNGGYEYVGTVLSNESANRCAKATRNEGYSVIILSEKKCGYTEYSIYRR